MMRMRPFHPGTVLLAAALLIGMSPRAQADGNIEKKLSDAELHFIDKVKPLLASRCIGCHGSDKVKGSLRLDSREATLKGGDTGPSLIVGKPGDSLVIQAIKHSHPELKMPPKDRLAAADIAVLERWIKDGAPWPASTDDASKPKETAEKIGDAWKDPRNPITKLFAGRRLDLWSLKPLTRPKVPAVNRSDWPKNDLDRFVLARLESESIAPPAKADARTLARRLYFDLTGLPPTPQQIAGFEQSVAVNGFDKAASALVEELLGSPRYGEHFARMWLDVVRYSDSNGFDWDEFRPQAWRFRDYVVRSFNADKPFDQFIREQLAGDELFDGPPRTAAEQDALIATGFLRLGPHDNAAPLFDEQDRSRAELLADMTETTASAFLGITLSCCRCHDHKYDPLSHADHYRFRAFFAAVKFADDLPLNLAEERASIKKINEQLESQTKPLRDDLGKLPKEDKPAREKLEQQIKALEKQRRSFTHGLLVTDNPQKIAATRILFQGDHKAPRNEVQPGFFSVMDPNSATISKSFNPLTTGRRLTLAHWIASPDNPLTARVFANRIWQQLMGRPLVATPNDFGLAGLRPEDAALLDWLADEFVRQGWSVKKLVRLIVSSAAYQQPPAYRADHFVLRQPRRLSAEQLRDALLQVSGLLTSKSDGPPMWPDVPREVLDANPAIQDDNAEKTKGWYPSPKPDQHCRTLFLVQKRNTRVPLLEMFDLPDNSTPCAKRESSTVAPQALMLLNGALATEAATALAGRVKREAADDPASQVRLAFELAIQRSPDDAETAACLRLLKARSLADLCRALLNLNEFAYID